MLLQAFVDLGKAEKPGLSYVALSRVKTIEGLLLQPFPFSRLASLSKSAAIADRKKWQDSLKNKPSNMFQICHDIQHCSHVQSSLL